MHLAAARMKAAAKREIARAVIAALSKDQWKRAVQILDDYLHRSDPHDIDLMLYKGYLLTARSRFEEGLRVYRQVLRIDRENPEALNEIANYYTNIRRADRTSLRYHERALRAIRKGRIYSDREDEFVEAVIGKAEALARLRRFPRALRGLLDGLKEYPANSLLGDSLVRVQRSWETLRTRKRGQGSRQARTGRRTGAPPLRIAKGRRRP